MSKFKPIIGKMHLRADGETVGPVTANHSDRYPFRIGPHTYTDGGRYYSDQPNHGFNLVGVVTPPQVADTADAVRPPAAILDDMAAAGFIPAHTADAAQVADLGEAGTLRHMADAMAYAWGVDHASEPDITVIGLMTSAPADAIDWNVEPGYEGLAGVFRDAHNHAARTKGAERHTDDNRLPFEEQPIVAIPMMLGSIEGQLYQVMKKSQEANRMAKRGDSSPAVAELLGVINYAAAAIIVLKTGLQDRCGDNQSSRNFAG
ncbi:hypothetical protein HF263_02895 [Rhizobium leguminosarum]|uniref:hypothetical protein n=1 Tax=Rhizobium leguminosarum TaxID=384 RepID=UPI001C9285E9|nr:hypothetical protein [Rhizobium leguminosarum]MBY3055026.1 hypothetical protein [Rhizobium leguminosarum]